MKGGHHYRPYRLKDESIMNNFMLVNLKTQMK